jgi:hypothetical protein
MGNDHKTSNETPAIARQQFCKYATVQKTSLENARMRKWTNCWKLCLLCGPFIGYVTRNNSEPGPPGWGSLKYRDNKLYSWVPWDSNLRKATLAMPGKNWKLQTRLLVREGAPHQQTRNCRKIIKVRMGKLVACPRWVPDTRTDWPNDCRS